VYGGQAAREESRAIGDLLALLEIDTATWTKVKGRAGVELNERCDALALAACRGPR